MQQRWIAPAALAATLLISACSGGATGSGTALPAAPAATSPLLSAQATFTVSIPHDTVTTSAVRKPKYLTPSVKGIDFQVQQDLSPSGSVQTPPNDRGYVFYALSPQSTYCTNGSTALTCVLPVKAYPGADLITVTTYDNTNPSVPGSNGGPSHIISTGFVTANIVPGIDNPIAITTHGVVSSMSAALDNPYPPNGTPLTQPLRLMAMDASSYIIIGNYDMPLAASTTDTTGAITVSNSSIASSANLPNVVYSGASVAANIIVKTTSPYTTWSTNFTYKQAVTKLLPGQHGYYSTPSIVSFAHASSAAQIVPVSSPSGTPTLMTADPTLSDSFGNPRCNGIVTASLSGTNVTITPVAPGVCGLPLNGSGANGTIPVVVSP